MPSNEHRQYLERKARQKQPQREGAYAQQEGRGKRTGIAMLVLVAIAMAIGLSIITGIIKVPKQFAFGSPAEQPSLASYIEDRYNTEFLTYVHPFSGFSIDYPAGYLVAANNDGPELLKFTAFTASGMPVVTKVLFSKEKFNADDFRAASSGFPYSENGIDHALVFAGNKTLAGNTYYTIESTQESSISLETLFVTKAFLNCPAGGYAFLHSVPASERTEQTVFYAVLESFKCPVR